MTNAIKVLLQMQNGFLQQHFKNILNQIKAQGDQKIIVWIEYFPYKYSFKVISND
jgi:hypothetical protein